MFCVLSSEGSEPVHLTECLRQTDRTPAGQGVVLGFNRWHDHGHNRHRYNYHCIGRRQVPVLREWPVLRPQGAHVVLLSLQRILLPEPLLL